VIVNDGPLDALEERVREVWEQLRERLRARQEGAGA
jgi:hypothetical protein